MTLDQNSTVIDVDTNEPFCFLIPQSIVQSCQLNGVQIHSKTSVLMINSNKIALWINYWGSVNVEIGKINVLRCGAGLSRTRVYYTSFYSLSKYHL